MAAQANYQQAALAASIRQGQRNGALLQLGPYSTTPSAQNEGSFSITNTGSTAIQFVQVIYVYHETDTGVTDDGVLNEVVATFNAGSGSCVTAPASTLGIGGQCDYTASVTLPNSGPYAAADNCGSGMGLNMTCHAQRPAVGVVTFLGNVYWYNYTAWVDSQPANGGIGSTTSISFTSSTSSTSTTCEAFCTYTVAFTESGLPSGTQWKVTFDNVIGTATAPGSVYFVNVPSGSYFWVSESPVPISNGEQYVASPGYGNTVVPQLTPQNIAYSLQYSLTMISSDGTLSPPAGTYWYNPGQAVAISESPNQYYIWNDWAGTGTGSYSGPATVTTITINSAITETAIYTPFTLYTVTFTATGTLPSGDQWCVTFNGVQNCSTTSTILFTNVEAQSTAGTAYPWSMSSVVAGATGVQYCHQTGGVCATDSGSITVPDSGACTCSASIPFTTQYYLTMTANPSSEGTVSPASGWYDAGSTPTITVTPDVGYSFAPPWVGTGTGSYSGTSASHSITMSAPISETASFAVDTAYTVDFVESGLPSGTWGVTYNGTLTSTTNTVSFLDSVQCLSGGVATNCPWSIPSTYLTIVVGGASYVANPISGSVTLPATGPLPATGTGCTTVGGTTCTINITYTKAFKVIFAESNLPTSGCGASGHSTCSWNATLGSTLSSTVVSCSSLGVTTGTNCIQFLSVTGTNTWDIVTHNSVPGGGDGSAPYCNFSSSNTLCNTGNMTAGTGIQYNAEVPNYPTTGTYSYDNNSASSALVIPGTGAPANNPSQGLVCTASTSTCVISFSFVQQFELNGCDDTGGSGEGHGGGLCNDAATGNIGYVQLTVTSGDGPQPVGYQVENDAASTLAFNGAFGIFFNSGYVVTMNGVAAGGSGYYPATWSPDLQSSCTTQDNGAANPISVTVTSCLSEGINFSPSPTFTITCSPGAGGSCSSESHSSSVTATLSGSGFSDSTTYSYCLSSSPTSGPCVSGSGDHFTSSFSGGVPSGTTITIPSGTATSPYPHTYYVIVYIGTTVYAEAPITYTS
jgi:hypothetical protein